VLNTKLILVEGLPGAGKSTATAHLGTVLQRHGVVCRWFLEGDEPHPIPCLDFKLRDLPQRLPPLWKTLTEQALQEQGVTIIESRLWQNSALFMYMGEYPVAEIIQLHQLVWQELAPLAPSLVYLYQDDPETALRRVRKTRGERWLEETMEATNKYPWFRSRGLNDFTGWVEFFQEWQQVAKLLNADWPSHKTRIENPHDDWERAYQQICGFLQLERRHQPVTR
jgi:thymidylate kinase